jgi:hypothetical protein
MSSNLPSPYLPWAIQSNATDGVGGILPIQGQCTNLTFVFEGHGTITNGVVTLEEAYYDLNGPVYTGAWSTLAVVPYTSFNAVDQVIYHFPGSFWAVRARITTPLIGGGTVTITAWAN